MGFAVIPVKPGGGYRFAQHGLAESHAGQRYRVEGAERVERVAFMAGTAHRRVDKAQIKRGVMARSEEHTSELQSLMRISYAVFCLKKKKTHKEDKRK